MDLNYLVTEQKGDNNPELANIIGQKENAGPAKIILMLYEGCIKYLNKAIECADEGDIKNKNIWSNKAGDIICALNDALNLEAGGTIAENLRSIYVFVGRNLVDSIERKNTRGLREGIRILSALTEGWNHVAEVSRGFKGNPFNG